MNRQTMQALWGQFRLVHGVTLRALARIPADQLDARPIPGMRTVKELGVHLYTYCGAVPEAVLSGKLEAEACAEPVERIRSVADLVGYARDSFRRGETAVQRITDTQLGATVPTYWGPAMPGSALIGVVYDEHLHHRGQLYAYLRALGVEPPFMWGFEENEPEFQPKMIQAGA